MSYEQRCSFLLLHPCSGWQLMAQQRSSLLAAGRALLANAAQMRRAALPLAASLVPSATRALRLKTNQRGKVAESTSGHGHRGHTLED